MMILVLSFIEPSTLRYVLIRKAVSFRQPSALRRRARHRFHFSACQRLFDVEKNLQAFAHHRFLLSSNRRPAAAAPPYAELRTIFPLSRAE
jgi:hypothetical protein